MTQGNSDRTDSSMSPAQGGHSQAVCERFEAAWKSADSAAARPRIADFLSKVPPSEQSAVFCSLLSLELRCRKDGGEAPAPHEYLQQFPDSASLVLSVFQQLGLAARESTSLLGDRAPKTKPEMAGSDDRATISYDPTREAPSDTDGKAHVNGARPSGSVSTEPLERHRRRSAKKVELPKVPGYEILSELGKGGMGIVYKARDLQLERIVALKMILHGTEVAPSQHDLDRMLAEARAAAKVQHLNIVQIFRVEDNPANPYLSLEYVEGGSLHQQLAGTPQSSDKAARLVETLSRAMDLAHQKGIIHRDLKPSNILIAADGTPKITDFGLAKRTDEAVSHTEEGFLVGTPVYMAPEQAWGRNAEVGVLSDVYALGVILYEMLTGGPPFKAADKWQTVLRVRNEEPVPPRQLVPQVPRDLELICLKCLKKAPKDRFASALELAEELRRFQEGRPILTRPAPPWEQAWKWAKRKPTLASLIAVSVVALVSLVLVLDQRAREAHRNLEIEKQTAEKRVSVGELKSSIRDALKQSNIPAARGSLQTARAIVRDEPGLTDLKPDLDALGADIDAAARVEEEKQAAHKLFQKFRNHRDEAMFHGAVLSGVDVPRSATTAMKACRDALECYGVADVGKHKLDFSEHLTPTQRTELARHCSELLVVLAHAEAPLEPGSPRPTKGQVERALARLDQLAQLRAERKLEPLRAYHVRRAEFFAFLENPQAAEVERNMAVRLPAAGALDYFLMGYALRNADPPIAAAGFFQQAVIEEPNHFFAWYFLGLCNLRMGESKRALDNFTACRNVRDDFIWLHIVRGIANGQLQNFRAAHEDFRNALTMHPDPRTEYGILINQGDLCLRQAKLPGWVPVSAWRPLTPSVEYSALTLVSRKECLSTAARFFLTAIERQGSQHDAHMFLGLVHQQQKEPDEAVKQLTLAIQKFKANFDETIGDDVERKRTKKNLAHLYSLRARVHAEQSKWKAALEDLNEALTRSKLPEDFAERGRVHFALKEYAPAVTSYHNASLLQPDEADYYLGKAESLLAQKKEKEAAAALGFYLVKDKTGRRRAEVYRLRGLIYVRLKQFPDAIANYGFAIEAQGTRPDAATYAARGWVLLYNRMDDAAFDDFEKAIQIDKRNAEAYAGRGLFYARTGKTQLALDEAEWAVKIAGEKPSERLLWNVAHVYARLAADKSVKRDLYVKWGMDALDRAFQDLKKEEAVAFWREYIVGDGLLNPLRTSPQFERLRKKFGS